MTRHQALKRIKTLIGKMQELKDAEWASEGDVQYLFNLYGTVESMTENDGKDFRGI